MRTQIIRNISIGLFSLIVINLFYLQVIRGGYFHRLSQNNSIRVIPFEGERGRILDRNGKLLAESHKAYHAVIVPQDLGKNKVVFSFLSEVLNESAPALEARYLRNKLTPFSPVSVAEGISRSQAIRIEENAFRFPGLLVLEKYRRQYPYGEAGAHVIGYVAKPDQARMREIAEYGYSAEELVGYAGVEEAYDDLLRGKSGGREIEVNSLGRQVRILSVNEPSQGSDITLTIDADIQRAASNALGGRRGSVVILDPDTGEVLAMVSSPAFDPNVFGAREGRSRLSEYFQSTESPFLNRATSAALPPGSVFKVVVSLAALEGRKIDLSTTYDCPGFFQLGNRVFRSPHAWGPQDLRQAMGHSANEYFFHVGLLLGPEAMGRYARMLGLGTRTGVDLPYESSGNIPSLVGRLRWFKGDTVNMSIGQGNVLATPIQLARMIAAFVNGGYLIRPYILKAIKGEDICGVSLPIPGTPAVLANTRCRASASRIPLRKDVWETIRQILYAPVKMETGTANMLDIPGLETFGKTGTAQSGGGRGDHAWFAGITKSSKRRIAYAVLLENGGASSNACEVVKEVLLTLQEKGTI